jgi:hypothetical protein
VPSKQSEASGIQTTSAKRGEKLLSLSRGQIDIIAVYDSSLVERQIDRMMALFA